MNRFYQVHYASPSVGNMSFGWSADRKIDGATEAINNYRHYDNPWSKTEHDSLQMVIVDPNTGVGLRNDFAANTREFFVR